MPWSREQVAARVAEDIEDGWYVNIGVGIPTLVPGFIPPEREVLFQSENGVLGMVSLASGEVPDPDLVDAGKRAVAVRPGGCCFESSLSFAMIRGGHIDLGVVGALQVSLAGDIANWRTEAETVGGIGGAADVCSGVRNLWVAMAHLAGDAFKLMPRCSFPLTAAGAVSRVYSDLAVLERRGASWVVLDVAPGVSQYRITSSTGFPVSFEAWSRRVTVR